MINYDLECSSESSGFSFRFKESKDITHSNRTFNVSDKLSVVFVNELNSDLSDTTTGSSLTNDISDFSKYDFSSIHVYKLLPLYSKFLIII